MGEKRNVYRLLVGNPEEKIPLGRPRHRWIDISCERIPAIAQSVVQATGCESSGSSVGIASGHRLSRGSAVASTGHGLGEPR
jgi:hypothetical protein